MAASKLQALWNHPAGPKTIHFWAPTFKWGISIANIADFSKPPEKISYPQQVAVTCTGLIWSRYSLVITPKNWNLFSVNVAMAGTGIYQLTRKIRYVKITSLRYKRHLWKDEYDVDYHFVPFVEFL
ncbi:Mitochondrial pyruvate carrier 4 [Ananas comosus]|uniref:Mitochondrial pyruvate carrier n=1 Tax=Ananas comosus TaxID=4615 RepID=A0A199URX4_ANACO|nr:Mitochondrial pyruvate carrier 4 [Ananas comosus]